MKFTFLLGVVMILATFTWPFYVIAREDGIRVAVSVYLIVVGLLAWLSIAALLVNI